MISQILSEEERNWDKKNTGTADNMYNVKNYKNIKWIPKGDS